MSIQIQFTKEVRTTSGFRMKGDIIEIPAMNEAARHWIREKMAVLYVEPQPEPKPEPSVEELQEGLEGFYEAPPTKKEKKDKK